jgi:hypothetical protein
MKPLLASAAIVAGRVSHCVALIWAWLLRCRQPHRSNSLRQQRMTNPGALSDSGGHDRMFEQHDRWLEELLEYTNREEAVTCRSGYMPLTAIAQEIGDACADAREHDHMQVPSWESMASDLSDGLGWIGPELSALVGTLGQAIHHAITNGLLVPRTNARPRLDDTKRPDVGTQTTALAAVFDRDDVLVAAWRDLVAACQDIDHVRYPSERIAFLRDTLVGFSEHRKQDRRHFSPISTAVQVLIGNPMSVRQAQAMVGDPIDTSVPFDPRTPVGLTENERADLAARYILKRPVPKSYVVWFRLSPGYFRHARCLTHGDVTFYEAQALASLLANHDSAREVLDVVPEELLTDEIRDLQGSAKVDDHIGFQYLPGLVYARVTVHDVEHHRAVEAARMHLDAVLAVITVHEHMWKVLGGHLFYDIDNPQRNPLLPRWGLKEPRPETTFHENDHFARDLTAFTADGHLITAEIARQLRPPQRLMSALTDAQKIDSEAIVMAAVRAIEHCNTWTAPAGGHRWYGFVDEYLVDEYTLTAFAQRVVLDVFAAVEQYLPDHTPGAVHPPELDAIRREIIENEWGTRIDSLKTVAHVAALRRIYADHWMARRLAETDDIISSGAALGVAFGDEQTRIDARVKRLTRSRNAAIHGGPLSQAACGTIADFASTIAVKALNNTIRAIVDGQQAQAHAVSRRHEFHQRIENLQQGGDLANLFTLTP